MGVRGLGPSGDVRGALEDGREYRYSGASMGIGGIRGLLGGVRGLGAVRGVRGALGAGRECRYLGQQGSRSIGGVRGHWSSRGCIGGGRWTGSLTTIGLSPGSQHSHWFPWVVTYLTKARQGSLLRVPSLPLVPLGSDLPHQGQARAPVEGPITPTGFPWGVTYLAKAKQVTEMS